MCATGRRTPGSWPNWPRSSVAPRIPSAVPPAGRSGSRCPGSARWTTGGTDQAASRRTGQPVAGALPDVVADEVGTGVAVGDADVGATVGCGVRVWCGEAVRCGDAVADGLGVRWRGVRLRVGAGVGAGEALCCADGLSPAALAVSVGGLT